jgi:hypothetical protein
MTQEQTRPRIQIQENVRLSLDVQPGTDHSVLLAYGTSMAKQEGHCGHIYVDRIGPNQRRLRLTDRAGDYGPSVCARHGDALWVAHTVAFYNHEVDNTASEALAHSLGVVQHVAVATYESRAVTG